MTFWLLFESRDLSAKVWLFPYWFKFIKLFELELTKADLKGCIMILDNYTLFYFIFNKTHAYLALFDANNSGSIVSLEKTWESIFVIF